MKEKIIKKIKDSFIGILLLGSIIVALDYIFRFKFGGWEEIMVQILVIVISISNIVFIVKKYGEK